MRPVPRVQLFRQSHLWQAHRASASFDGVSAIATPIPPITRHYGQPFAFFFDRAQPPAWSFAGSRPVRQLVVEADGTVRLWSRQRWRTLARPPLEAIAAFVRADEARPQGLPEWWDERTAIPRTAGYFAYELGRFAEAVPPAGFDPVGLPLAVLSTYAAVDAWHPASGRRVHVVFEDAGAASPPPLAAPTPRGRPRRVSYRAAFERIQRAIAAGEIYQANLSRRIEIESPGDPLACYLRLRARQPVPWGAFLDFGGFQLLSNSPECFLSVAGEEIRTFPIKGTRPRHLDPQLDARMRAELLADEKERAEHLMIVDLERNDLGRVCRIGSIEVPQLYRIETYATLHHLVSEVRGKLRPGVGLDEILGATFPGGSITGAPKIRAMEIIAEVEPSDRGVYTGALGWMNGERHVQLSIAIRTAVVARGRVFYGTGGGIVADSNLAAEYRETELKAVAFRDALASGGFESNREAFGQAR